MVLMNSPISRRLAVSAAAVLTAVGIGKRSSLANSPAPAPVAAARQTRFAQGAATPAAAPTGPFTLAPLPYAYDALEPSIDARTMEIHHDRHQLAYVNNLNGLVDGTDLATMSLDELISDLAAVPEEIRTGVRNNAGGNWNHIFFWDIMSPDGGGEPTGDLATAIDDAFGSFDEFKTAFGAAGAARFGSGWAWLIVNEAGELEIISTPNQDNPLMTGVAETVGAPIIGVDVWEHAYYLMYQNMRPAYLTAWWDTVNWEKAAENYAAATA